MMPLDTAPQRNAPVDGDISLVPTCFVVVTLDGPLLPAGGGRETRRLTLAELNCLQCLAAGRGVSGNGAVGPLLDDLAQRGLLTHDRGPLPGSPLTERAAEPPAGAHLMLTTPIILRLGPDGFEQLDHDGHVVVRLSAIELMAATEFRRATTSDEAWRAHSAASGGGGLDQRAFAAVVRRLFGGGLLQWVESEGSGRRRRLSREDHELRVALIRQHRLMQVVTRRLAEHDAAERERRSRTGVARPRINPVHFQWKIPPLAIGMIYALARQHDGGRLTEFYDFRPTWLSDLAQIEPPGDTPAIFLFSHYIWSSELNLAYSAKVKAADPSCVTIHGGPNVPKYAGDLEAYFRQHPHVDIAVRGEGEVTAVEMLAALRDGLTRGERPDLSVLTNVAGLAFRQGERIVRTADRPRIEDLDTLPSPYLTGVFDAFGEAATEAVVLETNRGCPYSCTFCDWGSATAQRIRKFSLERVFAELEWCARHSIQTVGIADANFGIFERDIAVAEKVAELKQAHKFPHHVGVNYAKNSMKNLKPIVKVLGDAGVLAYGQLSLQSMDEGTLSTIERSNIKPEKYHELAYEFRRAGLPLFIDLMMGLPGSTVTSFRNDLQQSIDREVIAKVYPTQLLVNSPMNEPSYRAANGIDNTPGSFVVSTATFTKADYATMQQMRRLFFLLEKFGVLRHVARHVRYETGLREMEFYEQLWRDAQADRRRWPIIAFTLEAVPNFMVPPGSWRLLLDEVGRYVVAVHGIADDSALATVLAVQDALLPTRHRSLPSNTALAHDYVAWNAAMLAAKDAGHLLDWPTVVPSLRSFGPGTLTVQDPYDVCVFGVGHTVESDSYGTWELDSPVSRPVAPLHAAID